VFLHESKEINHYQRKSKFGKFVKYQRTKTLTHWQCDHCDNKFTRVKNGPYNADSKSYCEICISKIGLGKLINQDSYKSKIENDFSPRVGKVVKGKTGYPEVYIGKDYPYRSGGYRCIREHIFIMECHLERGLKKGEIVHHIDGDKTNNNLENLFLTTTAEHNKLHAESESIIFDLVKKGVVRFNRETARYELV